jgi:hypothetical protein
MSANRKARPKFIFFVVEGKGGIGKTTSSKALAAALQRKYLGASVTLVDTDPANRMRLPESCGIKVVPCDITHVRRSLEIVAQMDTSDVIVVDGRGGDADLYSSFLRQKVLPVAAEKGFEVVWIRPITTSHFTLVGIEKQAADLVRLGVRYAVAVMLHSGRTMALYEKWFDGNVRKDVMASGGGEIIIEDLGVDLIDNMAELGVSFVELLSLDFSGLKEPFKKAAEETFKPTDKLAVTAWLRDVETGLGGLLEAKPSKEAASAAAAE